MSSKTSVDYDAMSYVLSSRYRETTLRELADRPAMPSEIAEITDLSQAHVSRALKEMRNKDIVELLVSEEVQKGRIYGPTDAGDAVAAAIKERDS